MKSMNDRIEFFFQKLEELIEDPTTQTAQRINALKVYGTILPTCQNIDIQTSEKPIDISQLSHDDKVTFDSILKKLKK